MKFARNLFLIALVSIMTLGLTSCGKEGTAYLISVLTRPWIYGCTNGVKIRKIRYVFEGTKLTVYQDLYSDNNCVTKTFSATMDFSIGSEGKDAPKFRVLKRLT